MGRMNWICCWLVHRDSLAGIALSQLNIHNLSSEKDGSRSSRYIMKRRAFVKDLLEVVDTDGTLSAFTCINNVALCLLARRKGSTDKNVFV